VVKSRGDRAEARLWPTVDHYRALEPDRDQQHPIDALIDRVPSVRRARGRVVRLQERIRLPDETTQDLFRELCDARVLLESQQAEMAFNIGVDLGTAAGRQNAANRLRPGPKACARTLRGAAQALLLGARLSPAERVLALIEAAWSIAVGPMAPPLFFRSTRRARRKGIAVHRGRRRRTASR
jgi:hypothetical protein